MSNTQTDQEVFLLGALEHDLVVEMTSRSIQFDTTNPPGSEGALCRYFASILGDVGIESTLLDHGADRSSLVARIRGRGTRPGLLLTGHLDVVGRGDRPWRHDPWAGEVSGGRVYGRGASDMKGAVATMVAVVRAIKQIEDSLEGDLVLALTAGEETDSLGADAMLFAGLLNGLNGVIIGEPTDLDVYIAEKGNFWVEITTTGRTAHASMPELGHNAIADMAAIVSAIEVFQFEESPDPLLGGPTLSIGTIRGGVRPNVVPDGCGIEIDLRTIPRQSIKKVIADLRAVVARVSASRADIQAQVRLIQGREAVATDPTDPLVDEIVAAVGDIMGSRPVPTGATYSTDGAVLVPGLRIPMVICGPGVRAMAHQTDEYIEIAAMKRAADIYALCALRRLTT